MPLLQGKQMASGAVHGAGLTVHFGKFSLIFQKFNLEIHHEVDVCPGEWTPCETISIEDQCVYE